MAKTRIYLDTSVVSAYFDERTPERLVLTRELWERKIAAIEPVISEIVLSEIWNTTDPAKRSRMELLTKNMTILYLNDKAKNLRSEFMKRGIFSSKQIPDATHIAIAITNEIGYLLSWNYKHMVHPNIQSEVNRVSSLLGHNTIQIIAPTDL